MKTRITMVMFVALVLSIFCAKAQIAVNGVEVGTKMTKSEVIAKFGKPDKYLYQDSGDNGVNEWYHYGETHFVFKDECFIDFAVCDKNLSVTLGGLDSDITVGDNISVLSPLDLKKMDRPWQEKDLYCVYYNDAKVIFKIEDHIIKWISYFFPD